MARSKMILIATIAFFVLLFSRVAFAIPIPQGIDGIIYELDGVTEVRSGIDFYVKNEATDKTIYGKTGHGSSGRYSVSINGNTGDVITIRAWNKYNQVNASLSLNGVMRNANLLLNMTYPQSAPTIDSYPSLSATEDRLYNYQVEVFDENEEDLIEFSLFESPNGMSIDGLGMLTWIPGNDDVGLNHVTIFVNDGVFLVNQSFDLFVENVNDEVIINSTPITEAKVGKEYVYDVDAHDADNEVLNYSLVVFPQGMEINRANGLILWKPKGKDKGPNKVVVGVSDGTFTVNQGFTINVISSGNDDDDHPKQGGGGSGGGSGSKGGGGAPNGAILKKIAEKGPIVAVKLPINNAGFNIEELSERPKDAKRIDRKVYRYLIIENVKQIKINNTEGAQIDFAVDKKWLKDNRINPQDVIMTRYNDTSWKDLVTINVSSDDKFVYYVAKTPGFSYFAISIKEGVKTFDDPAPIISKIHVPYRFSGIVHNFLIFSQAKENTKIFFENLKTGKIFTAETGGGPHPGAYYIFVEGDENDPVSITIEGVDEKFATRLRDTDLSFMLNARKTGFVPITGNVFFAIMKDSVVITALVSALMIGIFCRVFLFKHWKKRKRV